MKKMKYIKLAFAVVTFFVASQNATAQQLPYLSHFDNTGFLWNPAMTGVDQYMRTSIFYRQQWLGFENAPRTGYLAFEYPWLKQNMSFGGAIITDQSGPVSKNGIKVSYAYKLERLLNRQDQMSFGISADFTQFTYDPAGEVFNDAGDLLLTSGKNSLIFPSVGAGFYYTNNVEEFDDNSFYFGLSGTQVYSTQILFDAGNFKRHMHWFSTIGTKIYLDYQYKIEPRLQFNVVNSELIDVMAGVLFEMEDTFWTGLGYSSAMELSFQGGYILPDALARYSELRIGALANIGLSDRLKDFGPGFEVFLIYKYDVD